MLSKLKNRRSFFRWKSSVEKKATDKLSSSNKDNNLELFENTSLNNFELEEDQNNQDEKTETSFISSIFNELFYDLNDEFNLNDDEFNLNDTSTNLNDTPINLNSKDKLNADDVIIDRILNIIFDHNLSKKGTNDVLELIEYIQNTLIKDKSTKLNIPKNFYHLKEMINIDLAKNVGFQTTCKIGKKKCNSFQVYKLNSNEKIYCYVCKREVSKKSIMYSKNYYFFFDISQLIKLILENVYCESAEFSNDGKINSVYDGSVYKELYKQYKEQNKLIISLMFFSDGVPLFHSSKSTIYPLFFKINELNLKEENKVFLLGCYLTDSTINTNFFLNYIVNDLNMLSNDGVYIDKLNCKIYPLLINFLFDTVARRLFLNHVNFNTNYGCTYCYQAGKRIKYRKGRY